MTHDAEHQGSGDRRRSLRVPGPFTGRRCGELTVPIRIYDLCSGGCLIESFHEVPKGRRMTLEIDLPPEGLVRVEARVLYERTGYGYAVEFVDVEPDVRAALEEFTERRGGGAAT